MEKRIFRENGILLLVSVILILFSCIWITIELVLIVVGTYFEYLINLNGMDKNNEQKDVNKLAIQQKDDSENLDGDLTRIIQNISNICDKHNIGSTGDKKFADNDSDETVISNSLPENSSVFKIKFEDFDDETIASNTVCSNTHTTQIKVTNQENNNNAMINSHVYHRVSKMTKELDKKVNQIETRKKLGQVFKQAWYPNKNRPIYRYKNTFSQFIQNNIDDLLVGSPIFDNKSSMKQYLDKSARSKKQELLRKRNSIVTIFNEIRDEYIDFSSKVLIIRCIREISVAYYEKELTSLGYFDSLLGKEEGDATFYNERRHLARLRHVIRIQEDDILFQHIIRGRVINRCMLEKMQARIMKSKEDMDPLIKNMKFDQPKNLVIRRSYKKLPSSLPKFILWSYDQVSNFISYRAVQLYPISDSDFHLNRVIVVERRLNFGLTHSNTNYKVQDVITNSEGIEVDAYENSPNSIDEFSKYLTKKCHEFDQVNLPIENNFVDPVSKPFAVLLPQNRILPPDDSIHKRKKIPKKSIPKPRLDGLANKNTTPYATSVKLLEKRWNKAIKKIPPINRENKHNHK